MGWFGDRVVLGQAPRKNGCICCLAWVAIAALIVRKFT